MHFSNNPRIMVITPVVPIILLAFVAPVVGDAASIGGEWMFRLDPNNIGEKETWQDTTLPNHIQLPGTTDEAGYGEEAKRTEGTYHGYLTRLHKYIGPAWYQREIEVSESWKDRDVELFLERVLWESKVWLDGRYCDSQDSLGTPHRHQLGKLSPGRHRLTVRINNAMIHPIGDKGHSYTEDTQTIWNGILGRIELIARSPLFIESQRVFPNNDGTVRVELKLRNRTGAKKSGTATARITDKATGERIGLAQKHFEIGDSNDILVEQTVKCDRPPRLWSEFSPDLYQIETQLQTAEGGSSIIDSTIATFGFRTIGRDGHHITINGRPTFIRGSQDCVHFPLSGYPSCNVEDWRRIFRIYRQYGLNQVRFHSWCPPDAAFQAADELGLYIQAEMVWIDQWMNGPNKQVGLETLGHPQGIGVSDRTIDQYVRAEMRRIMDTYGNHPSFVFFVIGNELGSSDFRVLRKWIFEEKSHDPRRFYAASTARAVTDADDFLDTHKVPDEIISDKPPVRSNGGSGAQTNINTCSTVVNRFGIPHTDWNYEDAYRIAPVPIIAHEAGQMPVYPIWNELDKYKGVLRARGLEECRRLARKHGIESQCRELQQASGVSQCIVYKAEMEAQLRSPSAAGINWLNMQDYSGQGEALVGWLDSFYDSKDILTPAQFRRYSNTTVPLVRTKRFVWTTGERFQATAQLAHWGPEPLRAVRAEWRLRDAQDNTVASGKFPPTDCPIGSLTTLGPIEVDLRQIKAAVQLNLDVALRETTFANDWNLWVFPEYAAQPPSADVVTCDNWEVASKALKGGKKVLLLANRLGGAINARYSAWLPVFWSATFDPTQDRDTLGALVQNRHFALAGFPTNSHLDWQWYDLCKGAHGFVLDDLPADYRPIVQPVGDFHFSRKLGSIFELRTKTNGRLLVCGYDIGDNLENRPAARQLRRSLLDYASSARFNPTQEVTFEYLEKLLSNAR